MRAFIGAILLITSFYGFGQSSKIKVETKEEVFDNVIREFIFLTNTSSDIIRVKNLNTSYLVKMTNGKEWQDDVAYGNFIMATGEMMKFKKVYRDSDLFNTYDSSATLIEGPTFTTEVVDYEAKKQELIADGFQKLSVDGTLSRSFDIGELKVTVDGNGTYDGTFFNTASDKIYFAVYFAYYTLNSPTGIRYYRLSNTLPIKPGKEGGLFKAVSVSEKEDLKNKIDDEHLIKIYAIEYGDRTNREYESLISEDRGLLTITVKVSTSEYNYSFKSDIDMQVFESGLSGIGLNNFDGYTFLTRNDDLENTEKQPVQKEEKYVVHNEPKVIKQALDTKVEEKEPEKIVAAEKDVPENSEAIIEDLEGLSAEAEEELDAMVASRADLTEGWDFDVIDEKYHDKLKKHFAIYEERYQKDLIDEAKREELKGISYQQFLDKSTNESADEDSEEKDKSGVGKKVGRVAAFGVAGMIVDKAKENKEEEEKGKAKGEKESKKDTGSKTLEEQLTELKALLDKGLISEEDYKKKKDELLKNY